MHDYDAARFDPPAPLALVNVRSGGSAQVISDVPMLIDTGADVSLLPHSLFASFISPGSTEYELEAFDGSKSNAPAITAELNLLGKSFRGQFLLIDS